MNISILHLSDIHLKSETDSIFEKQDLITDAIKNKILHIEYLFIVVTGDIANAGSELEYNNAKVLLLYIKDRLAEYKTSLKIEFIIAPGNHDCDFTKKSKFRDLTIKSLSNNTLDLYDVDSEIIDQCTFIQENFFNFRESIESKDAIDTVLSNKVFNKYNYLVDGKKISFNVYNLAWMSQRHESQAKIFFPCFLFKDKIIKESNNNDLNITVYHHPLHWLHHSNLKNLKELINISSNIVLSGHEHSAIEHSEYDYISKTTQYIDSPALQTSNPDESAFKLLEIDMESGDEKIYDFEWDRDISKYAESKNDNNITLTTCMKHFPMKDKYVNKVQNAGIKINHSYKSDVSLDDMFVYQDIEDLREENLAQSNNASKFKEFEAIQRVIIFGEETSGKTALAHILQIEHKQNGKIPIYINGKDIKAKDHTHERINTLIEKSFLKQYDEDNLNDFKQEDKLNILIIIDDFTEVKFSNEYRSIFIDTLVEMHENIMIFSHTSLELESLNDDLFGTSMLNFNICKIKEFGHKLRDKLIKQWVLLGREHTLSSKELHQEIVEKAKIITTTLGYNIVPSYPIFMLTLLQSMESNNTNTLSKSTYGHYYSYLITDSLTRNGVKKQDFDTYYSYLASLAFFCFEKKEHSFNESVFSDFHDSFRNQKRITLSFDETKRKFISSNILVSDFDNYKFKHDYIYYFFIAKFLGDNIDDSEIRLIIEKLIDKLHRTEFGNILMFLIHHTNTNYVLTLLLTASRKVFSDIDEFGFRDDELIKINLSFDDEKEIIELDDVTPEQARENYLENKEESEQLNPIVTDRSEADIDEHAGQLDLFAKLNLASKIADILGEISKNYYGSLDGNVKVELIRETYSLTLRSVNMFVKNFEEHHELIVQAIDELLEKKGYNTQDKMEITSKKFVFNILSRLTEGFISKLSKNIASKNLLPIYHDIASSEPDNKAIRIINNAIDLDFPNGLKDSTITHYLDLKGNYLAQATVKKLVIDHLHMFHTEHDVKDRFMEKFDLNQGSKQGILIKSNK